MISAEVLSLIKNDAVIVNTCPPELIDQDALADKLKNNKEFFYIFDHADELSKEEQHKIMQYENCIAYPPIGFISNEARIAKQEIFIGNAKAALEGNPQNVVNG